MTDLSLLKYLVAVVETGNFSRAAERLCTSQSGVSRAIARLEDELGVALFERTTRAVRLTPAGDVLFAEAARSLERISVAIDAARRIGQGAHARLRIGICQSVSDDTTLLQRGLNAFRARWPHVEVRLSSVMGVKQAEMLRHSDLDVGIRLLDSADCADLSWKTLSRAPLTVTVPASWGPFAPSIGLADLKDRPWILPDPALAGALYESTLAILRSAGFEPKIGGVADDRLTAQIMLACGLGAALSHARVDASGAAGYATLALAPPPTGTDAETIVSWADASNSPQIECLVECLCAARPD